MEWRSGPSDVFACTGIKLDIAVGIVLSGGAGQILFDGLVNAAGGAFGGDANGILNSVRVRRSVTDDSHAFQTEQWRASVFGVVEPALEVVESFAGEQVADLARDGFLQRLFHHGA